MTEDVMNADGGTTPIESEGMSISERAAALDASLVSQPQTIEQKEPSRLDKLVEAKGGPDKFVDALFENWNSMSAMSKQVKELQTQLESLKTPPVQPIEAAFEAVPEIKEYEDQIKNTQEQISQAAVTMQQLSAEYGKASQEAHKLEGQLEIADAMDKPLVQAKLSEARSRMDNLDSRYVALRLFAQTAEQNKSLLSRQAAMLKSRVQEVAERERNGTESASVVEKRAQQDFLATSDEVLNSLGVQDATQRHKLMKLTHAEIREHFESLPNRGAGVPMEDVSALTRKFMIENARGFGIRSSAFAQAEAKLSTSPTRVPTSVNYEKLDKTRADDPEFWKHRASLVASGPRR